MDKMNEAILACLKGNARMSWQQIGKEVHLTGQAVAARVAILEDKGVINGYTIRQNNLTRHFITVFMESNDFSGFERFLHSNPHVESAFKVSGDGCYQLTLTPQDESDLEVVLNCILKFGRYKVLSAMRCIK